MTDAMHPNSSSAAPAAPSNSAPANSPASSTTTTSPTPDPAANAAPQNPAPTLTADKPVRPDWLPEDAWDADKGLKLDVFGERFKKLTALEEQSAARAADIPADARDYKPFAGDYRPPEGMEIIKDSPVWDQAREFAKAHGWTNKDLQDASAFFVQAQATSAKLQQEQLGQAMTMRDKALGANAAQRVDSLTTWMATFFGGEVGKHMAYGLVSPEQVKGWELVKGAILASGTVPLNASGREGGDKPGAIPGFENMTFEQKWAAVANRRAA